MSGTFCLLWFSTFFNVLAVGVNHPAADREGSLCRADPGGGPCMEGQNRAVTNTGKLQHDRQNMETTETIWTIALEQREWYALCLSLSLLFFSFSKIVICVTLCLCRCLWLQKRGTKTSVESKNWKPASQSWKMLQVRGSCDSYQFLVLSGLSAFSSLVWWTTN